LPEADVLYEAMNDTKADALELLEPTCLQMRSLEMRGRMEDAMRLGRALLARFGVLIPKGYEDSHTAQRLDRLGEWLQADKAADHVGRRPMREPRQLAVATLLGRMVRSAYYMLEPKAFTWLLLEGVHQW